jgi:protein-L-isoaspartate(D-aspartate) O-methyltransferase
MDFAEARRNMVLSQIAPSQVTDRGVLRAMGTVPRERFVPVTLAAAAYVDEDIRVAEGRYLLEPVVLARLLQAAAPVATDLALDIGCATGYSSAVLAQVVGTVVALENDPVLAKRANDTLSQLGITNAAVVIGDLARGRPDQGPYNLILINGCVENVPRGLLDQLADGGRLATVIGRPQSSRAALVRRTGDQFSTRYLFDATVGVLPGFSRPPEFVF